MASGARKAGSVALIAATYSMVAGSPFGLEEIVSGNGYRDAIAILLVTPLLWALPVALLVAELASAMPETGGFYVWVRRALGPFWGFLESWLTFVGSIFDMAIYPILFSACLSHLLPVFGLGRLPYLAGLAMIALCVGMNLLGTRFVGEGSVAFVLFLLAPFAVLCWTGFASASPAAPPPPLQRTDLLGGILIAMWNYMGWDNASLIAGEVQNARRAYLCAMLASVTLVVITYIVPILSMRHAGVPLESWETGSWVSIAEALGGRRLALFLTLAGMVAALSTFNALVLSLSRLPYAMARDGFLPRILARENRRGAPWIAILVCAVFWAAAMGLGFSKTVMLSVMMTGLSILLEFAALIAFRLRQPELPRSFRIPGGWPVLILLTTPPVLLIAAACVRNRGEQAGPISALTLGAILVAAGALAYPLRNLRRPAAAPAELAASIVEE